MACHVTTPPALHQSLSFKIAMHMDSPMVTLSTECPDVVLDTTVTSECGIQAASDTVCRGAQVTPLTRDAGCQYEDAPVPMTTARSPLLSATQVIKPSPIKQSASPPGDSAVFLAAKALQQLHQSPPRSTPLLAASSPDSLLQHQISALQSQALKEPVKEPVDPSLLRGLGSDNTETLASLLQPGLMNSLPLTSYALLLDVISRQSLTSSTNSTLLNHINELSKQTTSRPGGLTTTITGSSVLKPTPTLLNSGALCHGGLVSSTSPLVTSAGLASSGLNGTVFTPTTLTSPLLNPTSTNGPNIGVGGLLNGMSYMRPGISSPPVNVPTMLNRQNGKRGLSDSKRDMDIESIVDSVIDEHMGSKQDNKNIPNSFVDHLNGSQNCLYNRSDAINDYEMTPPFKRRRRTVFTEKQLQGLEEAYGKSQYLDRESRLELCKQLSLSLHTVVYWFQNKRAISRRRGQPLDNSGMNSNSSSIENIHVYSSDNVKTSKPSPPFKTSPPHSPIQFGHFGGSSSPVKPRSMPPVSTMLPSPPASLMSSPNSSLMSATLTSAISQNVLSMSHMVGATI